MKKCTNRAVEVAGNRSHPRSQIRISEQACLVHIQVDNLEKINKFSLRTYQHKAYQRLD